MRLPGRGWIDRGRPVTFTFDGVVYQGCQGDTLASALLANDVRLVGRSFKYHRPRGILTAGSEEPNALVTVGTGALSEPNVRATTLEIWNGLVAESQNRWPSLRRDALAINDVLAPFLGAGFYYKTFMWPKRFWEAVYEPLIRRAAGLGRLTPEATPDQDEKAFAFCEVLVIGAGPAGLMAALTAGRAGCDVILADEGSAPGGRLLSETEHIDGIPGADWAAQVVAELSAMPNVRLMTRTTVTGAYDQGTYAAVERLGAGQAPRPGAPRQTFWRIVAPRAVLCAGAIERPIAFADNDRPGIMLAGAVRAYVNRYGVAPGARVAVFGNNDDAHQTVDDLVAAGVEVVALIDSRSGVHHDSPVPVYTEARVIGTRGRRGLERLTITHRDGRRDLRADCLAVSGGWSPTVHLTCHLNGRPEWSEKIAAFVPRPGTVPGLVCAGACAGTFDTAGCLTEGAGVAAAHLGVVPAPVPSTEGRRTGMTPLWVVEGKGRKWLDFQNDVTEKDVRLSAQEAFRAVEHMKRYTTQGMATDQGKTSNVGALAILADATGRGIPETGITTFRPPFVPVSISAMGAGGGGAGFAPVRRTTSDAASRARGAPMIEAGLWYRPAYFPAPGEARWRESCDREVRLVRQAVGVCDVSTLGKIDVQGPDAAVFLDFVYTNTISTLPVGRVRYGLMLREDGHVMDDGTVARLGAAHFVLTTTTAAAGQVMQHLEFVAQVLRPDLDVTLVSVTEHWAQFAVAGPQARRLLNGLLDRSIADDTQPFMSCGPVWLGGVAGRLFRISFSGEHAYEIAVPARFGAALYRLLVAQAEGLGGGAYGMEALNVLRIEKGFLTHAEIDGRVTADDLGLSRMVRRDKDCIGQAAARRPGLQEPGRLQLVGLRAEAEMPAGAHLFAPGAEEVRQSAAGHVTSTCWSPTLKATLALALLADGRARHGATVVVVDHLRGVRTPAQVCDPVFLDPEGGRMRG